MYRNESRRNPVRIPSGGIFRRMIHSLLMLFSGRRGRAIHALRNAVPENLPLLDAR